MAIRYRFELIDFRGLVRYPATGCTLPVSDRHASTLARKHAAPSFSHDSNERPARLRLRLRP